MDKKQAQTLIKETFESPFDKNKFIGFVKNLLNDVEEATFMYKGNYIPDAYEQYINTLERIGKYTDGEHKIDILIAKLKKETSIERARTMQRNFVAWYLNGSRGGELKDAALVAFVAPNEDDWRFSLVKMDYRYDENRNKVVTEFTPARRWSFLVGVNENSHTAQSQLVDLVADDERNPALTQLEEAFNIEKVTKEFFEKYRELFLWTEETLEDIVKKDKKIKGDFETKGVETVDFSKKLLGQIVFLYFLQKKGWFGVKRDADWGTGPKNFLRELFDGKHGTYKNFFNDILEPLFYEALRIDRSHDDDYYSKLNCRIPFLNGGLFDPINNYDWVHTDIFLPNDLFSNDYKTKEGDKGNGILDIFDRYNFTVKEDEPLEKEVAVDPEMLGKVFENLLEVKDRKSKGTYYTPREIVHYMCQQSLINYLATELSSPVIARLAEGEAKQSLPTKGDIETLIKHGEHLGENETIVEAKGRETSTYFYKFPESIRQNAELIDKKLIDIKICDPAIGSGAFPVGMMGEIVRTRNVLSAYIKGKDRTIYNFKRECIEKSLYGVDIDPGAVEIAKLRLWLSLVVDEDDIEQIKPLPNLDYKIICGNSLLGVEKDLFNSHLFSELERLKPLLFNEINPKKKQEYKKQIDEIIIQITHGHKEFDVEVYFSEVFHEKKGFDVVIANPPYVNLSNLNIKDREIYKKIFTVTKNKVDLYAFFIERGNQILKSEKILTYIVPHTWKATMSFSKLRELILKNFELKIVVELDYGAFEATVKPVVIVLQKHRLTNYQILVLNSRFETINEIDIKEIMQNCDYALDTMSTSTEKLLFKKIEKDTIPLEQVCKFTRGIKTSNDEKFVKRELLNTKYKKVIRGRNIDKYSCRWDGEYVWYRPDLMKEKVGSLPHNKELFEVPEKLILQRISKGLSGNYDDQEMYALDTCLISDVKTLDKNYGLKFILALINSRLLNFWYYKKFSLPTVSGYELHQLPLKQVLSKDQRFFINLVDKILAITKSEDYLENNAKQAKVKDYEYQIDQMVYELYGLTKEEIKIVEGGE